MGKKPRRNSHVEGIDFIRPKAGDDPLGTTSTFRTYRRVKPDMVYLSGELGSAVAYSKYLPEDAKFLSYQYIEGAPIINQRWLNTLANTEVIASTQYGADIIYDSVRKQVPWVYSGVDHRVFNVMPNREEMRKFHSLDDKFIIMCAAQNVRRKQITRLIEAVGLLRHQYKRNDVFLYLHASPFQSHWLDGWNLFEVVNAYGVGDITTFHPGLFGGLHSFVPERSNNVAYPGLAEMYNMADLFVLPSQVEGFGLPIAEAMTCGLPVAVTKYAAGWEVARPAGVGLEPHDWEVHKSGARYANVAPAEIAKVILNLMRNPNKLSRMRDAGLQRAQDFKWDKFHVVLLHETDRILSGYKASPDDRQEKDQG